MRIKTTAVLMALIAVSSGGTRSEPLPAFTAEIAAGAILAISDGDFVGQTYATGRLPPVESNYRDMLSVISLVDGRPTLARLPVSNSVTSAPEILAVSPDGRTAFVTERLAERTEGAQTVRDLRPGRRLFAIDLTDKTKPRLVATADLESFPEALSVSPDGRTVAVVANTAEASVVQLVSFRDGAFGTVRRFDLKDYGVVGHADGPRGGVLATNVHWHPNGRALAVNITTQDRVAFFALENDGGQIKLVPWGAPVQVSRDPFVGRFSPDGQFFITSDWGRNFSAEGLEGRLPTAASRISVIRLDIGGTSGPVNHAVVGTASTDVSAEGLAISPDGRLVATINMRGTAFPSASGRFQRQATVTLLSLDPASGAITKLADYPVDGVLPEGGTFDLTGDHFLATVFHGHENAGADQGAGLEVFRVDRRSGTPALVRLGRIAMPHGVHHVAVSP